MYACTDKWMDGDSTVIRPSFNRHLQSNPVKMAVAANRLQLELSQLHRQIFSVVVAETHFKHRPHVGL